MNNLKCKDLDLAYEIKPWGILPRGFPQKRSRSLTVMYGAEERNFIVARKTSSACKHLSVKSLKIGFWL